jgi:nucleotide-binding universal stress UspA family protein
MGEAPMKNVLVLIHDDPGQVARLQAALDLTRATNGHLNCVHVTEFAPIVGSSFEMSGAVAILDVEVEIEAKNRLQIENRLTEENVSWDWVEVTASMERAVERTAGLADVIVANCEMEALFQPSLRTLVERLVVRSGKPVVAVPDSNGFHPAEPVLIAWDGSDPVAAAVRASVPLLRLSERVTLYEIDDGTTDEGWNAAEYLSRHDVHAEIVSDKVPSGDLVEPVLLSKVASGQYGWAVMGAFSRPRFVEGIFGGVTKRMLKESPIPLFIAH